MKLAYIGTPAVAVPPLRALVAAGHTVQVVVTGVDKRRGRGSELTPSPVKSAATALGLPVSHAVDDVLAAGADLGVVVAFGRLIRPHVLDVLPMVNLHFSLLPRWRGAAPVERAILAGDSVTGVCLMQVASELDAGDVYACREVAIGDTVTADELRSELTEVGSRLLVDTLDSGLPPARVQRGEITYAAKLAPAELRIDWSADPRQIDRLVRVGGAWTMFRDARVKVLAGSVVDDVFVPSVVQPAGRSSMDYAAWRNGARLVTGEQFD